MKKLLIAFSFILLTGSVLQAQDLKKARSAYNLTLVPGVKGESIENAKTEVDKLIADDKTNKLAESYLLKMQVYSAMAKDSVLLAKYPTADLDAMTALKKYLELEPNEEKLKADRYKGVNEVYNSFFTRGLKYYQVEDWDKSFNQFKSMVEMGDILIGRKWSASQFDTTGYLYAGATAQNAKKEDDAVKYYTALANLKLGGKEYSGIYEYLTKYYLNHPNDTSFNKYNGYAKELYPEITLWKDLDFEYNKRNSDVGDIVKKFDAADATKKLTSAEYFDYGIYFVGDDKIKDMSAAQKADYNKKAIYAFGKAYELDTANAIAAFNAGITTYSNWQDFADSARAIKGTTADVKTKKTAANNMALEAADHSINWFEKAVAGLSKKPDRTKNETGSLNKAIDLLYNIYEYKRDMSRGVNPKDYDKYDAKLTYYNSLHGKY